MKTKKTYKELAQSVCEGNTKIMESDITRFMSVQGPTSGSNNPAYSAIYHYLERIPHGHPYYAASKAHRNSTKRKVLLVMFRNHQRIPEGATEEEANQKLLEKFLPDSEIPAKLPAKRARTTNTANSVKVEESKAITSGDMTVDVDVIMESVDRHVSKLIA